MQRLFFLANFVFFGVCFQGNVAFAQGQSSTESEKNANPYSVNPAALNTLRQRAKKVAEEQPGLEGFRIQLYSSSGAESYTIAAKVQNDFQKLYPDIPSYVVHQKPSFKVRVGDYRHRLDAERFLIELKESFPDAFIVKDRIEFPALLSTE
jgi:hypothetical protein